MRLQTKLTLLPGDSVDPRNLFPGSDFPAKNAFAAKDPAPSCSWLLPFRAVGLEEERGGGGLEGRRGVGIDQDPAAPGRHFRAAQHPDLAAAAAADGSGRSGGRVEAVEFVTGLAAGDVGGHRGETDHEREEGRKLE